MSPITYHNLTPEQVAEAARLSPLQIQAIQNIIHDYAMDKLNRMIDPLNPVISIQADARTHGAIEALQYLIELSLTHTKE